MLAAGCASTPPAPPAPTLSVEEARRTAPVAPVDVRWGGTITDVRNTAEGTTVLEIVSRPLRRGGRPIRDDRTDGRFLAEVDEFLDPEIVVAGRDVTVTGSVATLRDGRIGESAYRFPVVAVDGYRYWKPVAKVTPVHFPHPYPLGSFHHGGFHHGWPHGHHHGRRSGLSVGGAVRF